MGMFKIERKWLVLFAAFYANACTSGLVTNLSVLYVEWLAEFDRSKAETAVVQSVCTGGYHIAGACAGVLVTKFGPRTIGMISATLSAVGFSLAFFASSVMYLIVLFGIPTAVGSSGIYLSSVTAVGQYFDGKQRQMVLAVMSFGSGVGGIIFTYLLNVLCIQYGWRGGMLLIGGIVLQNVSLLAICKPKQINQQKKDGVKTNDDNELPKNSTEQSIMEQLNKIARNKLFYLNCFAFCCLIWSFMSSLIFVDFFNSQGYSRDDAVLLYLIMTISNAVFRLVPGFLKQFKHFSTFGIVALHSGIGTISFFMFPNVQDFTVAAILMGCIGLSMGGTLGSAVHYAILKITDTGCFSLGLGITMTIGGLCRIIAGPITGYIKDVTGSYDLSFYVNGSVGLCGVLSNIILLYLHTAKTRCRVQEYSINNDVEGK